MIILLHGLIPEKHSDIISKMDEILQTGATVEKCAKKQLKPPPQCTINRTASGLFSSRFYLCL